MPAGLPWSDPDADPLADVQNFILKSGLSENPILRTSGLKIAATWGLSEEDFE